MNAKRVLILTVTALAAAGGGYALLGLRAPSAAGATPTVPTAQGAQGVAAPQGAPGQGYVVVLGPDGTTYLVQAPDGAATGLQAGLPSGTSFEHEREEGGREHADWD